MKHDPPRLRVTCQARCDSRKPHFAFRVTDRSSIRGRGRGSAGASCKCRHTVNRVSPIRRLAKRFAPALPVVGEGEKSRDADIRDKNTMVL